MHVYNNLLYYNYLLYYNTKYIFLFVVFFRGDGYIEMDVNIHKFATAPKKALQIMMGSFDKMFISAGFCIESREDNEMPETLFVSNYCHVRGIILIGLFI